MNGRQYPLLIVLLVALAANASQAASRHVPIDARKGTVVSSAGATLGGPAPGSAMKSSGARFPLVPAGGHTALVGPPGPNQPHPLPTQTRVATTQTAHSTRRQQAPGTAGTAHRAIPPAAGLPAAHFSAVAHAGVTLPNAHASAPAMRPSGAPKTGPEIRSGTASSGVGGSKPGGARSIKENTFRQSNPRTGSPSPAPGAQAEAAAP